MRDWGRSRKYNRYVITDRQLPIGEIAPIFKDGFSRPPPSTTRPSLRGDIARNSANSERRGPCVTQSVTINRPPAADPSGIVPLTTTADRRPRGWHGGGLDKAVILLAAGSTPL